MRIHLRLTGLALLAAAIACDELTSLDQEAPSRVLSRDLIIPANAQLLVISAVSDFECALADYIVAGGLVGDELVDAQLAQAGWDHDRRSIVPSLTAYAINSCDNNQVAGPYTPINVARYQADVTLRALEGWTDEQVANRTNLISQAAAHAGYSLILLGEAMCTAAIDGGPELTRAQVFAEAEARFNTAITAAQAASNDSILNMARVGRARARLNQGNLAGARTDAQAVPATFVRQANYGGSSAPLRRQNTVHFQQYVGNYSAIDPSLRGLTVPGPTGPVPDTRVEVFEARDPVTNAVIRGHDGVTPIWRTRKYPERNSSIAIASYDEAQLIMAEVDAAAAATAPNAITIINGLRTRAGLPAYQGGVTQAEIQAAVREERRRELFLEGQRLNDIIRFNVTLSPAAGTSFKNGGVYGSAVGSQACFPLPDVERNNNPNISS
jgi:starch-binding outer membrane protein, SusD/RagB family